MNNKAHLRPKDFDSNGDIIPMACKEEKGDLISREALKKYARVVFDKDLGRLRVVDVSDIDNAPTVDPIERIGAICNENCGYNPQGEYVDISKLRLMTVEECAGHTIEYAMGWKACIEWLKKGGAE